jgi:hypothetical protein
MHSEIPTEPAPEPLGPTPSPEQVLDVAVELTFPASDPIAIEHSFQSACRREQGDAC